MRAISQDKKTAALMGVNVDNVISKTFIISGLLAGAAGVMWGLQMGLINYFMGFLPGIKGVHSRCSWRYRQYSWSDGWWLGLGGHRIHRSCSFWGRFPIERRDRLFDPDFDLPYIDLPAFLAQR